MSFKEMKLKLLANFKQSVEDPERLLFETDVDKDVLWNLYLDSFPAGTNEIFRERREHDCSCCRHFIKEIGGVVYIDDDLTMHSIFEFDTGSTTYQPVMDALAAYVTGCNITGYYIARERYIGTDVSHENDNGKIRAWDHFHLLLPGYLTNTTRDTIDTARGQRRDTRNVFKRSLDEISMVALDTILELIASNTLYKGEEWKKPLAAFKSRKEVYDMLSEEKQSLFAWKEAPNVGSVIGRIRNHSIGVLLTDVSSGMDLNAAVTRYEKIVAPANYKRPKAIFTARMLEEAKQKITDLGYMDSLPRRFATLDDITVNNILFSNRDASKRIGGSVFDEMLSEAKTTPKRFDRAEEIPVNKFIADVLPCVTEMEVYVENRHAPNMVSLIAPANADAPSMFKWNNSFSWAYSGNITDSDVKENVKSAGGRVDGVLRFSIQWNDTGEYSRNDLDAHCITPMDEHIFFGHKRVSDGGNLDVDITRPIDGVPAVENITWPDKRRMYPGVYNFFVHQYANRGGRDGFRAEIEFDGQTFRFDYRKELRQGENVDVAAVQLKPDGTFTIVTKLPADTASVDLWGVKTNNFVPVTVAMYSPNYWDAQTGIGHRHYFFMLKDCVNTEQPNGFYNEFLKQELAEHKRVFEALGGKMAVQTVPDQLSGLGFSSTKRNTLVVKVKGATERIMKILF